VILGVVRKKSSRKKYCTY